VGFTFRKEYVGAGVHENLTNSWIPFFRFFTKWGTCRLKPTRIYSSSL